MLITTPRRFYLWNNFHSILFSSTKSAVLSLFRNRRFRLNFGIGCFVSFKLGSFLRPSLWTPIKGSPKVLIFDNTRKFVQLMFFSGKIAFCLKKLCFQQILSCYRKDPITSTVIFRITFGPLKIVRWGLLYSIIREKIGQNLFFYGKITFFKSLRFQQHFGC